MGQEIPYIVNREMLIIMYNNSILLLYCIYNIIVNIYIIIIMKKVF